MLNTTETPVAPVTPTPGPWRVETWHYDAHGERLAGSEIVICGEEFRLALACSSAPVIINGKPVANPYGVQPEVARKNAVLMASAPLLLAALDRLQANPNDPRCHGEAIAAMKAARGQI